MKYQFKSTCYKPVSGARQIMNPEGTIIVKSIDTLVDLQEGKLYKVTIEKQ